MSRLCRVLDEQVRIFRERPLEGRYPYLWLDAKVERVREGGGVRHKALVVAYGVHETGRREVIGIDVGQAETEAFWREFLRGLLARGLDGVLLCVSDAHEGLKKAIAQVLGCPWQRCTVHFLRDMQGHVHRSQQQMVAAAIRQVFAAGDAAEARTRLAVVAGLEAAAPKAARPPRGRRGRTAGLHGLPGSALDEATLDQPPGALEQGDRPQKRRGRHLPQRRQPRAPRRRSADRAERRMARGPTLPLGGVARRALRHADTRGPQRSAPQQREVVLLTTS